MYLDANPNKYPTIIFDEPTMLFPASNLESQSQLSSIEELKSEILGDLATMAVVYGIDNEHRRRCARFIFSTSSATVGALLSTRFDLTIERVLLKASFMAFLFDARNLSWRSL
jgi:hypothetical protein